MANIYGINAVTPRNFTSADIVEGQFPRIYASRKDLVEDRPEWMKRGLQETASGYGRKLNSGLKINFNGKLHRIYITCFSNAGTAWFKSMGKTIYVD